MLRLAFSRAIFVWVIVVVYSVRNSGKTELKPEGGVAVITIAFGLETDLKTTF